MQPFQKWQNFETELILEGNQQKNSAINIRMKEIF